MKFIRITGKSSEITEKRTINSILLIRSNEKESWETFQNYRKNHSSFEKRALALEFFKI